jgi:hypothetical protein
VPERFLISLYAAGGLLFAIASSPVPIFYAPAVEGLLVLGAIVLIILWAREHWKPLRGVLAYARTPPALLLALGTVALLSFEVINAGSSPLPNAFDGASQALFVRLLLLNHVVPFTLQPYATAGVIYPQGTAVWLSLPALLWGWPVVLLPAVVPLLFLSLSIPAVYCWGERWGGFRTTSGRRTGLLLSAFFGVTACWPRLFVGGSYDFALALPLVFLILGWLVPLANRAPWSWRETAGVALLVGTVLSLSVAAGETLLFLLVVTILVIPPVRWKVIREVLPRVGVLVAFGLAFLLRSVVGSILWFSYPGHILSAAGSPPYHSPAPIVPTSITYREVTGMLDPFVLWKGKLSPFPYLSLEIAVLLAIGIILLATVLLTDRRAIAALLPKGLPRWILTYLGVTFAATAFLVLAESTNPVLIGIESFASVTEESILLFIGFQVVAALPLLAAAMFLGSRRLSVTGLPRNPGSSPGRRPFPRRAAGRSRAQSLCIAGAILLIAVPLSTGVGFTLLDGPGFLRTQSTQDGNATPGDFATLEWAGTNLPACSRVLVAPGSAALFLPEYADAQVVFPMIPTPVNLSYNISVANLTSGVYGPQTQSALLSLEVTEVFVTGKTSVSYAPFQLDPLLGSPDFTLLHSDSDAYVFGFSPGILGTSCGP